jgi:hypothetical protein
MVISGKLATNVPIKKIGADAVLYQGALPQVVA